MGLNSTLHEIIIHDTAVLESPTFLYAILYSCSVLSSPINSLFSPTWNLVKSYFGLSLVSILGEKMVICISLGEV